MHIFSRDGPINPAFMQNLLETTLATQPLPAGASPERRAEHRLATMHAIAAFQPADALEAMLAGQLAAANARMMRCFALAADPGADKAEARRDGAQATALIRCTLAMRRDFQRQQAARRKDEDEPSERAGYWFRDVSVPAPEGVPADRGPVGDISREATGILPEDPIHHEEPARTSRHDPMQSGNARPAATDHGPDNVPPRPAPPAPDWREACPRALDPQGPRTT